MKKLIPILLAAMAAATTVEATLSIPTDLPDVVRGATLIVRGRVTHARAFTETANGPVTTAVTLSVSEVLKGRTAAPAGESLFVTFRVPGGVLGRYRQIIVGAPSFILNEEAFVFLKRGPDGTLWPVGLTAGVYVVRAGATPDIRVVNPPVVMGQTASVGQVVRGDVRRTPMPVQDFSSLVRLVMASQVGAGAQAVRR